MKKCDVCGIDLYTFPKCFSINKQVFCPQCFKNQMFELLMDFETLTFEKSQTSTANMHVYIIKR